MSKSLIAMLFLISICACEQVDKECLLQDGQAVVLSQPPRETTQVRLKLGEEAEIFNFPIKYSLEGEIQFKGYSIALNVPIAELNWLNSLEFSSVEGETTVVRRIVESSRTVVSMDIGTLSLNNLSPIWFAYCFTRQRRVLSQCPGGAIYDQNGLCAMCSDVDLRKYKNTCVEVCPTSTIYNSASNTCIDCEKYIYNNQCTTVCPTSTFVRNRECVSCKTGKFISNSQCSTTCDSDNMVNISFFKCHRYTIGCEQDSCIKGSCSTDPHFFYNINWRCKCELPFFGSLCQNHTGFIRDDQIRPVINSFPEGTALTEFQLNLLMEYYELLLKSKTYSLEANIGQKILRIAEGYTELYTQPEQGIRLFDLATYVSNKLTPENTKHVLDNLKRFLEKSSIYHRSNSLDMKFDYNGNFFRITVGYENRDFLECMNKVRDLIGNQFIYNNIVFKEYFFEYVPEMYDMVYFDNPMSVFSVFDFEKRLPVSRYCTEDLFNISFERDISSKINIEQAFSFQEQGINLFDPSAEFFNSKCIYYRAKDEDNATTTKDTTIQIRRNEYFKDPAFLCSETSRMFCTIDKIVRSDSAGMVTCNCKGVTLEEKQNMLPRLKGYWQNNIMLIKCYKSFFDVDF